MTGELEVTTAHLGQLAAKQGRTAAAILSATAATEGVDTSVRVSHGVISSPTAAALRAANDARHTAGKAVGDVSDHLEDSLELAARSYDGTDEIAESVLGGQIRG